MKLQSRAYGYASKVGVAVPILSALCITMAILLVVYTGVSLAVSFSILKGAGSVSVGGNASVLLNPNGFESVIQSVKISPSIENSRISVHTEACNINTLSTQELSLPVVTTQTIASSQRIPLNYYGGDIPLHTIDSGSITYSASSDGSTQESCLFKIVVFTDYSSYRTYLYSTAALSSTAGTEFCIYKQGTVSTSTIPLNSTGFYFIAAVLQMQTSIEINMTANVTVYNNKYINIKMCSFSSQQTLCSIDTSSYRGSTCIFVQSEQYQILQYTVKYTSGLIALVAFAIFLLVLIVAMILAIVIVMCYLRIHKSKDSALAGTSSSNTKLLPDTPKERTPAYYRRQQSEAINDVQLQMTDINVKETTQGSGNSLEMEAETTDQELATEPGTCSDNKGAETSTDQQELATELDSDNEGADQELATEGSDNEAGAETTDQGLVATPETTDEDQSHGTTLHNSIFNTPNELSVDNSGLIHHCSQYGVTLIIPEGAVQQPATVWFGACLFSDKFKFEGNYVPVTPIVWVHIDYKLVKPAEIYLHHHINTNELEDVKREVFVSLIATIGEEDVFLFQQSHQNTMHDSWKGATTLKVSVCQSGFICGGVERKKYDDLPKRFLVVEAEKRGENDISYIDVCFLYDQPKLLKSVEKQYQNLRYQIKKVEIFTFEKSSGKLFLRFVPEAMEGWKRQFIKAYHTYTTEKQIDYYLIAKEGGADIIQELIDEASYPPRYQIKLSRVRTSKVKEKTMLIKIDGAENALEISVDLESDDTTKDQAGSVKTVPRTSIPESSKNGFSNGYALKHPSIPVSVHCVGYVEPECDVSPHAASSSTCSGFIRSFKIPQGENTSKTALVVA